MARLLDPPPARAVRPSVSRLRPYLVPGLVVATLLAVLLLARDALVPFLVGALYVAALTPFVDRLARQVGRSVAALTVILLSLLLLVGLAALLAAPLVDQLGQIAGDLPDLVRRLGSDLDAAIGRLPDSLEAQVRAELPRLLETLAASLAAAAPAGAALVTGLAGTTLAYSVIPFFAFYVLRDRPLLAASLAAALPLAYRADLRAVLAMTGAVLGRWIRGQLLLSVTIGVAVFVVLLALGLFVDPVFARYALVLALLAALLESLPIIGPIISALPAIVLGAVTGGPGPAVAVLVAYAAIQQLEGSFLVPRISGKAVRIHAAYVLVALPIGAAIAGPIGAVLALPVAALARDLALYAGARLADKPVPPVEAARRVGIELDAESVA